MVVCNENFLDTRQFMQQDPQFDYANLPTIYFVTPTYSRREQIPELTRLGQTLMHIPKIHWIVADDNTECNIFLEYLFNKFGKFYKQLLCLIYNLVLIIMLSRNAIHSLI